MNLQQHFDKALTYQAFRDQAEKNRDIFKILTLCIESVSAAKIFRKSRMSWQSPSAFLADPELGILDRVLMGGLSRFTTRSVRDAMKKFVYGKIGEKTCE